MECIYSIKNYFLNVFFSYLNKFILKIFFKLFLLFILSNMLLENVYLFMELFHGIINGYKI